MTLGVLRAGKPAAALLLGVLSVTWGCSEPTSSQSAIISGSVTLADGTPVDGASILVGYRPSVVDFVGPRENPAVRPQTIGNGSVLSLRITDACGELIRTVCTDSCSTDVHWDGRDEDGKRVLDGLYDYRIVIRDSTAVDGTRTLSRSLFIFSEYPDWDPDLYREPNGETGPEGTFEFDDRCLGFGRAFTVSSEEGGEESLISRWIDLLAVLPDGRRTWKDSVYVPPGELVEVDLMVEEASP